MPGRFGEDKIEKRRPPGKELAAAKGTDQMSTASLRNVRAADPYCCEQIVLPHHRAELYASGLSDDTIRLADIHSVTDREELARVLNWLRAPATRVPALVFPFFGVDGPTGYSRVKLDYPRTQNGNVVKYESPKGRPNEVYFPPNTIDSLSDPSIPLLITEGEKKALKADQDGFPCVGLVGVYGWKEARAQRLLPAMARIAWQGREVYIVFDSDRETNVQIREAETQLALLLQRCGANVKIVHLPPGPADGDGRQQKVGLDDFLVAQGIDALRELMASATDPEAPTAGQLRIPAGNVDPRDTVRQYREMNQIDGASRLVLWRNAWWLWADGRFVNQSASDIQSGIIRHFNDQLSMLQTKHIANFMAQLRAQASIPSTIEAPCWLGTPPKQWSPTEIVACKNQIVHLPTLVSAGDYFIPATPLLFTPAALEFDFDLAAPPPARWLQFLGQLWPDDRQAINTLQEIMGYCLTPDTSQQKIFLLLGPPRSGKGTIGRVLRRLVGEQNVAAPTLSSLVTPFGLWPLLGKTVAIISDARLGGSPNRPVITERLLSISGEDYTTVDRKYEHSVTTKLLTRILILSNELPSLSDASGAIASRYIILPLTRDWLDRENPHLTDELCCELPGILLWAVEGWRRLHDRGHFVEPGSAEQLRAVLVQVTSPVKAFIDECCVLGAEHSVTRDELFRAYREWCVRHGEYTRSDSQFGKDLRAAVPTLGHSQPRESGERQRRHLGIGLLSQQLAQAGNRRDT